MSGLTGFLTAAAQFGLESLLVRPQRSIGDFVAQVVLKERHEDIVEITDHPVEKGSTISDHAFIRPAEVTIECGWSNSPSAPGLFSGIASALQQSVSFAQQVASGAVTQTRVQEIYDKLLALQKGRVPFDVYTGKRTYKNMLIRSLIVETDKHSENILLVTATCRQVVIASTSVVDVPLNESHADPASTGSPINTGTKQLQSAPNFNPQAGP
jgi:hypothetical protein